MLSSACKYAIRALIYLGINGQEGRIGLRPIADDLNIPMPFLGKILQKLVRYKILKSIKGPGGGFSLGKDVDQISLFDIVEIIDGLGVFNDCLIGLPDCLHSDGGRHCPTYEGYQPVRENMVEYFKKETIGKLIKKIESSPTDIKI